jgi:hypothetical protein
MKKGDLFWVVASLFILVFISAFLCGVLVGSYLQQVNYEQWLYIRDNHMRYCTINGSIFNQGASAGLFVDSIYPNGTIIWKLENATDLAAI